MSQPVFPNARNWKNPEAWPAIRAALALVVPAGLRDGLPRSLPAGPDPVGTAALLGGLRAVPVATATVTRAVHTPTLVIDALGHPIVLSPGERRSTEQAASDRATWRLYRRLPGKVTTLRAVADFCRSRRTSVRLAVIIAASLAVSGVTCAVTIDAVQCAEAHRKSPLPVIGLAVLAIAMLLTIRDSLATAVQADAQSVLEPALWDLVLDARLPRARQLVAEALARAATSTAQLRTLACEAALEGLLALAMLPSVSVLLVATRGWFALGELGLFGALLLALCGRALGHRRRAGGTEHTGALLHAAFTGIDEVHLYARERAVADRALAEPSVLRNARVEEHLAGIAGPLRPLLLAAALFAFWQSRTDAVDLLTTVFATVLLAWVFARIDNIVRSVLIVGRDVVEDTVEVLEALDRPANGIVLPGVLCGSLDLDRVCLSYDGADRPVLDEVSLRIGAGEFVVIAGPSGSGKSALLRVIAGLDSPEAGRLRHGGTDLAHLMPAAVREQIGFVPQDGQSPRGSVRSVVLGTSDSAADERGWAALRAVDLEEEVRALPMGLATVVSGGSNGFSASQLQRMSLARALASGPRLLLLDDPVGAVDDEARRKIVERIRLLPATKVVVTHCPYFARAADRVVVLNEGAVVKSGPYDEVITTAGS